MVNMIDPAALAASVVTFIYPFLPRLYQGGTDALAKVAGKALDKIGEQVGEDGWSRATSLWRLLKHPIDSSNSASLALKEAMSEQPADLSKKLLTLHIERIFAADAGLAASVAEALARGTSTTVENGSFVNSGSVSKSTIIVASSGATVKHG